MSWLRRLQWDLFAAITAGVIVAVLLLWAYYTWAFPAAWWNEPPMWYRSHLRLELPLILAVLLACAWPSGRGRLAWFLGGLAGAVPLIGGYLVVDLFCRSFNRPPAIADLGLLPELVHADPALGVAAVAGLLALLAPPLVAGLWWCRNRSWRERAVALLARGVLVAVLVALFWAPPARAWWAGRVAFHNWSDLHCVKDFGHLATCWNLAARTSDAHRRLSDMPAPGDAPAFPGGPLARPRNLYLMLLESFVDPRDFVPPIAGAAPAELLAALPPDGRFDHCISPVFGGFSAQAEFELLTGAPALAAAGPIDYLWFGRRPCDGLVASAAAAGYRTVLVYGAGSEFFNAPAAHAALGFSERHYGDREPWGERNPADVFITDADLANAVLDRLHSGPDQRPTLTLIVGMEGHERDGNTFPRDRTRFPDVCSSGDKAIDELTNLFHWRSKAIASLIARLTREDPEAVVLLMADHQPAVLAGMALRIGTYAVPAVLLVGGQRVDIDGLRIRDLPWRLWQILSGRPCPVPDDDALRKRYEAIIGGQLR